MLLHVAVHPHLLYVHNISLYDYNLNILSTFHDYLVISRLGLLQISLRIFLCLSSSAPCLCILSVHLRVELLGSGYFHYPKMFSSVLWLLLQPVVLGIHCRSASSGISYMKSYIMYPLVYGFFCSEIHLCVCCMVFWFVCFLV